MTSKTHPPHIELRGVRVHNLQNIDLDIPLGKLIVITGVSGSGKSSLAFDTLYAEGQRRYVESFSTYSRRFLERFEKPDADRIEPIPAAVAVRQRSGRRSRRATVGTSTEIYDYLRLLFARLGTIECPPCGKRVERHTPTSAQSVLAALARGTRLMICFRVGYEDATAVQPGGIATDPSVLKTQPIENRVEAGFTRFIVGDRTIAASEIDRHHSLTDDTLVVVDRLTAGESSLERIADSLELAFRNGGGACLVLIQEASPGVTPGTTAKGSAAQLSLPVSASPMDNSTLHKRFVDGIDYTILSLNSRLICSGCGREFADPEPALFNFNSPLGACLVCRGTGEVAGNSAENPSLRICPECHGARLRFEARAVHVGGKGIVDLTTLTAAELLDVLRDWEGNCPEQHQRLAQPILQQAVARLTYLKDVGLAYLTLDRPTRTLSTGEAQRLRLAAAFGSKFVNMLYVLDEPTTGLHPRDTDRLLGAIEKLRDVGNSVVIVEHDTTIIRRADQVIDIGPGTGREGGQVVFQGAPHEMVDHATTMTAEYLSGRRRVAGSEGIGRRAPTGWLRLTGVEHHNLHNVSVDFPLGVLCVIAGVSGSGKSSLVEETLYPALVARLSDRSPGDGRASRANDSLRRADRQTATGEVGHYQSLSGFELIENVLLIDQNPIGRSGRANPVSFLNLFGEIRTLFAGTAEAKVHNFSARHFSFNAAGGGRCETCRGTGSIAVDMQFLPDVVTCCPDCHGARYRREILEARYRGLSIAEVLALTVREAFVFFRGRTRLQRRLKMVKDVGLDYITLGQPADTLSGGESQRLKLAAILSRASRVRTLFVLDEPTTGLHPADVSRLLDCLGQIVAGGHSLVVIEHNLDFIRGADYVIDLGPEAGAKGGQIVGAGTPKEIARCPSSVTGRYLANFEANDTDDSAAI